MNGAEPCGTSFEVFVEALLTGNAYIDVHTVPYMSGEVRGQTEVYAEFTEPKLAAFLCHGCDAPEETTVLGNFSGFLNSDHTQLTYTLRTLTSVEGVTQARIHCGAYGEDGPVAAILFGDGIDVGDELLSPLPEDPLAAPGVNVFGSALLSYGQLTEDHLTGAASCGSSLADLAEELLSGNAYVSIETSRGEVQGQVGTVATLFKGWNFVTWQYSQCLPIEQALAQLLSEGILNVAWTFNAPSQMFDGSYDPNAPPSLNTLTQVCPGEILMLSVEDSTDWVQLPVALP